MHDRLRAGITGHGVMSRSASQKLEVVSELISEFQVRQRDRREHISVGGGPRPPISFND